MTEPAFNAGEMVGENEGDIALTHEQPGINDTLQRSTGREHCANSIRLIQLANRYCLGTYLRLEPGMFRLWVDIHQNATES